MKRLNQFRFQFAMFRRRLMALRALLNKDQFLLVTYRLDKDGKAMPHKYVNVMPTDTIIHTTGLIHRHTKAQASVMSQVEQVLKE